MEGYLGLEGLKRAPAWVLGYLSSQGGGRTYNINEWTQTVDARGNG